LFDITSRSATEFLAQASHHCRGWLLSSVGCLVCSSGRGARPQGLGGHRRQRRPRERTATAEDSIQVSVRGAGVLLEAAQLYRADLADNGIRSAEQAVLVRIEPTADEGTWQVVSASGKPLLATDGAYRLSLRVAAPRPALPMPRLISSNVSIALRPSRRPTP